MIALPHSIPPARSSFLVSLQLGLAAPLAQLAIWAERRRQRRALQDLSDEMLRDIGLSRADVETEVDKPFWQD